MNSLSWLGILLGFFLPPVLFLAAFAFYKERRGALLLVACVTSFFSVLAVVKITFSSPYWERGTQVIWAGVTASDAPLIIGGEREDTTAAWPQYARAPQLTVVPGQTAGAGSLEISRGGAFVINNSDGQALNGTPLVVGSAKPFGDYTLRVNRLGLSVLHLFSPEVEVLDGAGKSLVGFSLRRDRARSLRHLIAGQLMSEMSESQSDKEREQLITASDKLEQWAATIWLLRTDDEKIYVLAQDDVKTVTVNSGAELTVRWPNLSLPIVVTTGRDSDGKSHTSLAFSSPWRLASPLPPASIAGCPPQEGAGDLMLSVTNSPRPCESSLLLPVGGNRGEFNHQVSISPQTNTFTGEGVKNNEAQPDCPPTIECEKGGVGTSEKTLEGGAYSFGLATVRNLPSRTGITSLLLLAWVVFLGGLVLAHPRMPETARGVVYALALVAWNFLAFRLLLSLRYALDPAALDKLAIGGVTRAFFGLTLVPGLLLLIARLRCDRYERPIRDGLRRGAMMKALLYTGALLAAGLAALYFPSRLWGNLPAHYYASPSDYLLSFSGLVFCVIIFVAVVFVAFHIKFLYQPDPKGILVRLFVSPWYLPESYFLNQGRNFWRSHLSRPWRLLAVYFVAGFGFFVVYIGLFVLAQVIGAGDKTAQEMAVPVFFCWVSLLWLGLGRHIARHRDTFTWKSYAVLALSSILMLAVPAVAIPFGIRDFGSILPVLALLLPLTWLLVVTLPWRAALCVAFAVVAIFVSGFTFYQNLEGTIPLQKQLAAIVPDSLARSQGRTFARLLNYKQGSRALQLAITANSIVGGEGLPYQELLNGNEHTWENRSMAHLGGMWGTGFGEAPTRRSRVRQDTLQYDSVYSFFVTSEYGLAGGMLLLLLYAVPLAALFIGGRRRFDAGYALAFIVASAFLIEALYHAGMNVGAFPLTGRNLPLLSVNSPSDLLRWTLLFTVMVTAVFWRYEGQRQIKDEAESLIEPPPARPAGTGGAFVAAPREEPLRKYTLVFVAVPALFAAAVLSSGVGVLRDTGKELTKYSHEPILKDVKWYLDKRIIQYDDNAKRLVLVKDDLKDPDERSFIQQEVDRFNAREQVEREEEFAKEYLTRINTLLRDARDLEQYNAALGAITQLEPPQTRQSVFSVKVEPDEDGNPLTTRIEPNQGFDVSFSFQQGRSELRVPKVMYGDEVLVGPAWVSGRFRSVVSPTAKLPWVAYLRNALLDESAHPNEGEPADAVSKRYGRLTLDKGLHEAALDFTAAEGVGLHETFLAREPKPEERESPSAFIRKLPRRVALSILSLPGGEALALGGWPTMSSERPDWALTSVRDGEAEKRYWVPPLSWIEHGAPKALRLRYGGDRNFDRTLVMGSTVKPIWAAAVLKVNPGLEGQLKVQGASGLENEAFGVKIAGKHWTLNSRTPDWVDFNNYLKTSDNRYHVRLGMLGFAQNEGGRVKAAGASPSRAESLSAGEPQPWQQYPAFTPPLRVTGQGDGRRLTDFKKEADRNGALAGTNFARTLRGMFSIGVAGHRDKQDRRVGEFGFRRSFWTKDEADDLTASPRRISELFNLISPEAVDLAFDELSRPRDYITMLLGGGSNMWANVDLAAAFGTCVVGRPVLAHIVANDEPIRTLPERQLLDPAGASKLHAGLEAVTSEKGGTAFKAMQSKGVLTLLKPLGVKAYAKTGTLRAEDDEAPTSRIVLALVKWKDEKAGQVETGLVFSLVIEEGRTGTAADWLAQFIIEHQSHISRLLQQKTQ